MTGQTTGPTEQRRILSKLGAARAMAAIELELQTIWEEGFRGRPGNEAWYAQDRFGAIAEIARAAAEGDDNAALLDFSPDHVASREAECRRRLLDQHAIHAAGGQVPPIGTWG